MEDLSTNSVLKSLESHYQQGKFLEAIELLEKNKSIFDPALYHFNLGTTYAKSEQYSLSRLHLEKALSLGADPIKTNTNINFVIQKLGLELVESKLSPVDKFLHSSQAYQFNMYATISLVFIIIYLVFYKKMKNHIWRAFFLMLCLMPLALRFFFLQDRIRGIVIETSQLKEGPSEVFNNISEVPKGLKIIINQSRDGWSFISSPQDYIGWIKDEEFKKI